MNPRAATPGPRLRPRLDPATLEPSILEPSTSRSLLLFVDLAVDEYDDEDISSDLSDDGAEPSDDEAEMSVESEVRAGGRAVLEKLKVQRVEKLCSEVREFGAELIDVDELASIYDFRIDKFQNARRIKTQSQDSEVAEPPAFLTDLVRSASVPEKEMARKPISRLVVHDPRSTGASWFRLRIVERVKLEAETIAQ
ncbi:hypothetical protein CRG98_033232 [Punica granatum]|uniref:Uncharacterized protein n=1 Tax=Punica granatum TaxID=22663 RepID=A0A2I0IQW4_PUNGR|nr:hypothetical protein CRG98_033232 [Punica granatum]